MTTRVGLLRKQYLAFLVVVSAFVSAVAAARTVERFMDPWSVAEAACDEEGEPEACS